MIIYNNNKVFECLHRTGELCNLREGARVAGTHCLRRRSLQQAPQITGGPAADAAAAPAPAPSNVSELGLLNFGPVPSLAVSYEVFAVPEPVRLRACHNTAFPERCPNSVLSLLRRAVMWMPAGPCSSLHRREPPCHVNELVLYMIAAWKKWRGTGADAWLHMLYLLSACAISSVGCKHYGPVGNTSVDWSAKPQCHLPDQKISTLKATCSNQERVVRLCRILDIEWCEADSPLCHYKRKHIAEDSGGYICLYCRDRQ